MTDYGISFDQLLALVGSASKRATSLAASLVETNARVDFIEPSFLSDAPVSDISVGGVLLISAPAAVGKSVLARELARRTGNPLIDLAGRRVGEAFFMGWLARQLGGQAALGLIGEVEADRATLIIDAADEALVGNGPQDYGVAVQDLADLIDVGTEGGPAAVILGRPDTIDETARVLNQRGMSTTRIEVAFFGEDQARKFVRFKAFEMNGNGPARELDDFLTEFFAVVLKALGAQEWSDADSFVGYAPVLDALATFYDPAVNMMAILKNIESSGTTAHVWGLLIRIIREVLGRETEKFATNFGGGNEAKIEYGRQCYTERLQLALLLADSPMDMPVTPEVEPADETWWDELETQVHEQFRVHPFVVGRSEAETNPLLRFTNSAFRDYVVAASLSDADDLRARVIRDHWCAPRVAPSPILMRLALSAEMGLDVVNSTALTLLVASQAAEFREDVFLEIEEVAEPSDDPAIEVKARLIEGGQEIHGVRTRIISGESIYLLQGIARTELDVPSHRVVAGEGAQEFSLGPLADVTCAEFASESPELRLRRGLDERPSFIQTGLVSGVTRRVTPNLPELLKLITSETAYPWSIFRSVRPSGASVSAMQWEAAMEFQGNARWYIKKSMVKGSPNYPADVMDTILAKGRASRKAHDFSVERGYITKEDGVYFFELEGFSIRTMVDADLENYRYRAFLDQFIEWAGRANGDH
ncbi:hypothetical protein [Microbacterium gilvum]|uniref:AAA+ ATPase domain-containing protein n=1 Tax=Microbacterium gilvum TaxID=1336204 RepID=A0ABP9ASX5_9MICO